MSPRLATGLVFGLLLLGTCARASADEGCIVPYEPPKTSRAKAEVSFVARHGGVIQLALEGDYQRGNAGPRQQLSRAVLAQFGDEFDFLIVFTDFSFPMGGSAAFYNPIFNDIEGIGLGPIDRRADYGSTGPLQGYVDMGSMDRWVLQPSEPGFEGTLSIVAHELMHRWGIAARYRDASGELRDDLLGRDGTHWSYYLDSAASVMYGARWQPRNDGGFEAVEIRRRYSDLDLYLAGMLAAEEVPDTILLASASAAPEALPQIGDRVDGPAENIPMAQVVAALGPRDPPAHQAQRHFRAALVLLGRSDQVDNDALQALERLRWGFEDYFRSITLGRATLSIAPRPRSQLVPRSPLPGTPRPAPGATDAVSWLVAQQQVDGSWADQPGTRVRDTALVLAFLQQVAPEHPSLAAGRAWLAGQGTVHADQRWWQVLVATQQSPTGDLPPANPDGGWAMVPGWQSGAYDSALSALAWQRQQGALVSPSLAYLHAQQNPDGGFGFVSRGASRQRAGLLAASVIGRNRSDPVALQRFHTWLASQGPLSSRSAELGERGRVMAASEMLWRASDLGLAAELRLALVRDLQAARAANGALVDSVYVTALAHLALASEGGANLRFLDRRLVPASATPGAPVRLLARIENAGALPTPASDLAITPPSGQAQRAPLPPLDPGGSVEITQWLETADWPADGDILLRIDPDEVLAETNRTDNETRLAYQLGDRPEQADPAIFPVDLQLDPVVLERIPVAGSVRGVVRNLGAEPAANVALVLESDQPEATVLAQTRLDLAPASSTAFELGFVLDQPRDWPLRLRFDPDNGLVEADETNNEARLRVALRGNIDLAPDPASLQLSPLPAVVGDDLRFEIMVHNHGTLDAPPVPLALQRYEDGGWVELQRVPLVVAAATAQAATLIWRVDREGEHRLRLQVDPAQAIAEADESNNEVERLLTIDRSAQPNLAVEAGGFAVAPHPLAQAQPFRVTAMLRNSGGQSTPPFSLAVYRDDPRIDGVRLGTLQVDEALAGGESRTYEFTIDDYPYNGEATLYLVADADNEVDERSESDNLGVLVVDALSAPDLVVAPGGVSWAPDPPVPGQPVDLALRIQNIGQQAAHPVELRLTVRHREGAEELPGRLAVPGIEAGGEAVVEHRWELAATPEPQALQIDIDPDDTLREADENNNSLLQPLRLQQGDAFVTDSHFSPDGDGVRDSTEAVFRVESMDGLQAAVRNRRGHLVRSLAIEPSIEGTARARWDGRDARGNRLPDGDYQITLEQHGLARSRPLQVTLDLNQDKALDTLRSARSRLSRVPISVNGWQMPPPRGHGTDHYAYAVGSGANAQGPLRRGIARSHLLYGGVEPFLDARWLGRRAQSEGLSSAEVAQLRFSVDGRTLYFSVVETTADGSRTTLWQTSAAAVANAQPIAEVDGVAINALAAALDDGRLLIGDPMDGRRLRLYDPATAAISQSRPDWPNQRLIWAGRQGALFGEHRQQQGGDQQPLRYAPYAPDQAPWTVWETNQGRLTLLDWRLDAEAGRIALHVRDHMGDEERIELVDFSSGLRLPVMAVEPALPILRGNQPARLRLRWIAALREYQVIDQALGLLLRHDDKGALLERIELPALGRLGRYAGQAGEDDSGYGGYGYGGGSAAQTRVQVVAAGFVVDGLLPRCASDRPPPSLPLESGSLLRPARRLVGDDAFVYDPLERRFFLSRSELVLR